MRKMNGAFLNTKTGRVTVNPPVATRNGQPVLGGALKPLLSTNQICGLLKVSKNQAQELRRNHPKQFLAAGLAPAAVAA